MEDGNENNSPARSDQMTTPPASPTAQSAADRETIVRDATRSLMAAVDQRAREKGEPEPPPSVGDRLLTIGLDDLPEKPDAGFIEVAMRSLRNEAKSMDALERQVLRSSAIGKLEAKGVRGAAALLDAALQGLGAAAGQDAQGQALALREPEPWQEPVDGAEMLDELEAFFTRYVVLPEGAAEALALWTVHTYCIRAAENTPRLGITSPTKRCGKSTLLRILEAVVARPLLASNITAAALFRAVEDAHPTLVIDEADTFLKENDELRGILNSGHSRSGAGVLRCVGDSQEVRRFSTWAPAAVALIGRLPATLEDRAILIEMRRRAPGERVERVRGRDLEEAAAPVRRRLARWARDWTDDIAKVDPEIPEALDDRAADGWRPLLAIAEAAGGDWPERARKAALKLSAGRAEEEDSRGTMLLADLRALFTARGAERLETSAILEHLHQRDERPWNEWKKGKPLSGIQLAGLLRPFGVRPKVLGGGKARGYESQAFGDAWSRYLPEMSPSDPLPRNNEGGESTYDKINPLPCNGSGPVVSPSDASDVTGLRIEGQDDGGGVVMEEGEL